MKKIFTVQGTSMRPTLHSGEKIAAVCPPEKIRFGYCYIFLFQRKVYIHRLVKKVNDKYFFIGDNSALVHEITELEFIGEIQIKEGAISAQLIRFINLIFVKKNN